MLSHTRLERVLHPWVWQDTNLRSLSAMDLQSTSFVHFDTYPFDGLPVSTCLKTLACHLCQSSLFFIDSFVPKARLELALSYALNVQRLPLSPHR